MESTTSHGRRGRKEGQREPYKFTTEKQREYLELLAKGGRRHASAYKIGITPANICAKRKTDPEFKKAMDLAERIANEHVESAMYRSAIKGNVTAQQVWLYNRMPHKWKDARGRDGADGAGDAYHYHFYIPDNQRTNEPINVNPPQETTAVLTIPSNGHGHYEDDEE